MVQPDDPYLITGRKDEGVYPRLEIRELQKNTEQFTLFIHGLIAIMQPEHRPKASRFLDLGGIHGLPYERWIGDPAAGDNLPEGEYGGYCNHESVLFPVWHRPYVLAIEQSIGEMATRFASRWTKGLSQKVQNEWKEAAKSLRFPFWDWTNPTTATDGLPDALHPQIFIFSFPDGTTSDPIENPLAFYDFGKRPDGSKNFIWKTPVAPDQISFFKDWRRTYRWPSAKENPIEDYIKIKHILAGDEKQRGSWEQLSGDIAKLFTYPVDAVEKQGPSIWDEFSNTTFQSKGKTEWPACGGGSIEHPHNSVHLIVGGLGDMADNDYAGFDPIFYLHHCNIDRILAFWEHVYPSTYWMGDGYYPTGGGGPVSFTQVDGTWAETDDADVTESSELQPFRKADGKYWDPNNTRFLVKPTQTDEWVDKWYTYKPIDGVSLDTKITTDEERKKCIKILQEHFGLHKSSPCKSPPSHPIFTTPAPDGTLPAGMTAEYRIFVVEVEIVGHAFDGSFLLQLIYKNQVIGSFAVLSRGHDTRCAGCKARREAGSKVRGSIEIPLDIVASIIKEGKLDSVGGTYDDGMDKVIVALREKLGVRLVGPSGMLLAEAVDGASNDRRGPLDEKIVPELKVRSAAAAYPANTSHGSDPIQFHNWTDHGSILPDGHKWKTA